MKVIKEISRDGKHWQAKEFDCLFELDENVAYAVIMRDTILFGVNSVKRAKKILRFLFDDFGKFSIVLEMMGFEPRIYYIREVRKPNEQNEFIDAEFEVTN